MAALQQNLNGLEGWGSFKKKIGLNKLGTRNAVKASVKIVKAVVAPSKKNATAAAVAASKSPLTKAVVGTAGNIVAPGAGSLLTSAADSAAAKEAAKQYESEMATITAKAVKEADAAAMEAAPAAAENNYPQWPRALLWGSLGLGGLAVFLQMRQGNRNGQS